MEKLSGLVLDAYDDSQGIVMRELFPAGTEPSELLKEAHALTADERERLPDHAFALVLEDGEHEFKKFATVDAGNTALSVAYFLKTAHKLPLEAQEVAAHNLKVACGWYGLEKEAEALEKVAIGGPLIAAALVGPGAAQQASANLKATRGRGIVTPGQAGAMGKMYRGGR